MPNVHTLVLYIENRYPVDGSQHRLLLALYSALPNLTTLHLLKLDTTSSLQHTLSLTQYAPQSRIPTLRHLGIQRGFFRTVQEVIGTVRTQKDVLRSIEIRRTCIPSVVDLLAVLQRELPCLENVEFEENTVGPWDDVWFRWADGEYDRGRHAREMVEEKGVRQTLDEMIAGLRLVRPRS
ncbi:hypothetical protein DBV05_g8004 [Lasiodiplodia theobromae]|uniref:Uncharacterized protein n=1 Tax=Lasiodiplodia theobromae TaxID=45133 RepID=A0A5N5D6X9_9PEZI|nr:hypothetical protein DBV05_g8004 [Lasiodiplodia theobromae]